MWDCNLSHQTSFSDIPQPSQSHSLCIYRQLSQFAEGLSQGCHGPATRVPHKARKSFHWYPYSRAKLPVLQELTQLFWDCLSLEMPVCRAFDWQSGLWISGQFPLFPDLVRVVHCAEQSFTVYARHVVYAEHLFSFWESGILVCAMWLVPTKHPGHHVSNELPWSQLTAGEIRHILYNSTERGSSVVCDKFPPDFTLCVISLCQFYFWILLL